MRRHLDHNDTVNTVRLELRHPSGKNNVWILVEGEGDQKLFSKLIDGSPYVKVDMVHGGVKSLRRAVSILIDETDRVLGIRDADFIRLNNGTETIKCLFLTDFHDTEMMMIACDDAFKSVVSEYLNSRLNDYRELRQQLLQSITFLSGIRWINEKENIELNFRGLSLANFFNAQDMFLENQNCIEEIHKRSTNKKRTVDENEILSTISNCIDPFNLSNGHDFNRAFALHANTVNSKGIEYSHIEKAFRIAYRKEDFVKTKLFDSLKGWEVATGYNIFSA